jgi:hypothetical protein
MVKKPEKPQETLFPAGDFFAESPNCYRILSAGLASYTQQIAAKAKLATAHCVVNNFF